ncbi:MAG: ATP-binding protein, partial [Bacteroidota bacterium]
SDSNMIGIIVGSLGGPISEANDAFLSMAGYSCADLEAGALQWTAMTPGEYQAADADALREIAHHGASRPYEKEYLRKDGTRVQVLMGLALLEGSSDTFIAFVLDLAEQKRIERELHAASKAKDHFLAVLSHELRTPLTPVLSLVQVLEEDESLADDTREFVDIIRRNVELEARLIDDLLDLTRVIQGKLMLQLAEIDVEHVIHQVLDICRADLDAKSLDLTVEWRAARSLMHGDSARLHQVFWNLLKNAAKFTPAGGAISIISYNHHDRIVVEVSDSGTGIDPEILPSIFNPFEQGTVQVTRRFGGLGLGLTISRSLIELHGGMITAASEGKDHGATFTVDLPLMVDAGHADDTPVENIPAFVAGNGPAIRRILLVEDHADTRRTIKKLLESRGYEVKDVGAIADALDAAASAPAKFDLLISDIGLPDGTGSELIAKLREREPIHGIAMSGYGMDHDIQRSLEAGFSSHIVKPVVFQQLIEEILRLQPA